MGLMKLSGDAYDYEEDTKIAMGVESMDANQVAPNSLADSQPAQVGASLQPVEATVKQPGSNVPAAPIPAPEQDIYSPSPKSLPPLPPNTRYASYEGTNMSRLKNLLNKVAMTQEDLDSGYSEIPQGDLSESDLFPQVIEDGAVQNYSAPADYSNYMSAKAPVAQESYDIGDYSDLPQDATYLGGFTSDMDVDPGVYQVSPEAMSYSPYAQGGYQSMGYDPYQAYANYEQMYASPTQGAGEYEAIQSPAPEVDPAQQAYQQSYTEIYNYLVQMGYSPEEAAAATPSLLEQVNVSAPQQKQASYQAPASYPRVMTKTASVTFNARANELKASYIEAGYSPYQAQEMSMEVVIPEAEKYASLAARAIGGGIGAVSGGLAAHSRYDEGEDTGALVAGALLGGGLGALGGGRVPAYLGKNVTQAGVLKNLTAKQDAIFKKQLEAAQGLGLVGKKSKPLNYNQLVSEAVKSIKKPKVKNPANPTAAEQKAIAKYDKEVKALKFKLQAGEGDAYRANAEIIQNLRSSDAATVSKALSPYRAEAGAAARAADAKKLFTGAATAAVPSYYLDRAFRNAGADNLVDGGIEAATEGADSLGAALSSGGQEVLEIIKQNPGLTAALATGAVATPYAIDYVREQRAKSPNKKGGRSKKAQLENGLQKISSAKAIAGYALGSGLLQGAGSIAGASDREIERYGRGALFASGLVRGGIMGAAGRGLGGTIGGRVAAGLSSVPLVGEGGAAIFGAETPQWLRDTGRLLSGTQEGGYLDRYQKYRDSSKQRAQQERLDALNQRIQDTRDARERAELEAKMDAEYAKQESLLQKMLKGESSKSTPAGNVMDYITQNPGKSALIGAGTAAGLYGLYRLATGGSSGGGGSNVDMLRRYQQQQLLNRRR